MLDYGLVTTSDIETEYYIRTPITRIAKHIVRTGRKRIANMEKQIQTSLLCLPNYYRDDFNLEGLRPTLMFDGIPVLVALSRSTDITYTCITSEYEIYINYWNLPVIRGYYADLE